MDTLRQRVPWFFNYTNGYEDTVSGSESIVLPKAKAGSLKSVKLLGGAEQSGTPTPSVPANIVSNNGAIKCSPNLCDVKADNVVVGKYISAQGVVLDSDANFVYAKYIPVKPNTTYTLTMSTPLYFVSISEYSSAQDSGFIKRNTYSSGTTQPPYIIDECVVTTDANTNYLRFGSNMFNAALTLADVLAVNWMLVQGSAQPYRPYGQIYTDGTVEKVTVKKVGPIGYEAVGTPTIKYGVLSNCTTNDYAKSVTSSLDLSNVQEFEAVVNLNVGNIGSTYTGDKYILRTANLGNRLQMFIWNSSPRVSVYFPNGSSLVFLDSNLQLQSNTIYWLKMLYKNNKLGFYYSMTGAEDSYVLDKEISSPNTPIVSLITYFMFGMNANSNDENWAIYLNNSYIKIDGKLWFGQENIPGNVESTAETLLAIASEHDIQEVISGYITRKIGVKVLDGTENWAGTTAAGITYYMADLLDNNDFSHLICTHFVNNAPMLADNTVYKSAGSSILQIRYDGVSDLVAFKSWLATQYANGTPVIVVYPLETPTTETVTGQPLQVVAGQNIAEITQASLAGLELEATYRRNK